MAVDSTFAHNTHQQSLAARINVVAQDLARTLRALLLASSGNMLTPPQLSRAFGVNKVFAQKLTSALRRDEPLAMLHLIPGPEPLRRLIDAARRRDMPDTLLDEAETAVAAFEDLIRNEAGDRSGLDAIISTWLPEARARFENVAKQSAYRGIRQLKGMATDVALCVPILNPARDDDHWVDMVILLGYFGLRCIRPGAILKLSVRTSADIEDAAPRTLDGRPIGEHPTDIFLKEFSSDVLPQLELHEFGQNVAYALNWGNAVGLHSASDLVIAEQRAKCLPRHRGVNDQRPKIALTDCVEAPARTFVFDALLHKDICPGETPELRIIENGLAGVADANDATRDLDLLDVQETITPMGNDFEQYHLDAVPNYTDLLKYTFSKTGWRFADYRGYRTQIEYPIYGSQIQMRFNLPDEP